MGVEQVVVPEYPARRRFVLLAGSWAVVGVTIGVAAYSGRVLQPVWALAVVASCYWLGCWGVVLAGAPLAKLVTLWRAGPDRGLQEVIVTWTPPVTVAAAVFVAAAPQAYASLLAGVAVAAVVNGITEEVLWRGAFVAAYPRSFGMGVLYPLLPFTCWHAALALVPGIDHGPGGVVGLIAGAAVLGCGWGWVVWHSRDLRSVTLAHVLTNFFGFTGLALSL